MNTTSPFVLMVSALCLSLASAAYAPGTLDPKKILESLSKDLLKGIGGTPAKRMEAMDAATDKLKEKYENQTGTLKFEVTATNKLSGRYFVYGEDARVRVGGVNFTVSPYISFDEAEGTKAAKIKRGDRITATGDTNIFLSGKGTSPNTFLNLGLLNAKLK